MSRAIYTGPLNNTQCALWRSKRRGRAGSALERLPAPNGLLVWGHSVTSTKVALGMVLAIAGTTWWFGGRRIDPDLWPLWLLAGGFGLAAVANFAFRERFTLDIGARRWHYWRGALRHETDTFTGEYGLAGLCLEECRRPWPNNDSVWVLRLEFADGIRYLDLGCIRFATQLVDARAEADAVALATGLPLAVCSLRDGTDAPSGI